MIAGDAEHLVPMFPEAFEELAGFPELLGTSALREIAADDDDVWLELVGLRLDCADQPLVVGAEMQVRQMDDPSHACSNKRHPQVVSAILPLSRKGERGFRNSAAATA